MNREFLVNRVVPILVGIISVMLIVGAMTILYTSFDNTIPHCALGDDLNPGCTTDLTLILKPLIDMNHPLTLGRTVASYEDSIIIHNTQHIIEHLATAWKPEDIQSFFLELLSQKKHHRRMQYLLLDACYKAHFFDNLSTLLIRMTTKEHSALLSTTLNWLQQKQIVGSPSNSLYERTTMQCLHAIIKHHDTTTLEALIKAGIKITKHGASELLLGALCDKRSAHFIPVLIKMGGDPNVRISGQSALAYAINNHYHDATQALLEAGATSLEGVALDIYSVPSTPTLTTIRQLLITYNVIES